MILHLCRGLIIDFVPTPHVLSAPPSLIEPQLGKSAPADPQTLVDTHHTGGTTHLCVIETP